MSTFGEQLRLEVYVEGTPVSVNAMYGSRLVGSRNGRTVFLSEAARAWRGAVESETFSARSQGGESVVGAATYCLPLKVACIFYGSRADADNLLKLTLDGLKAGLGIDDRHFAVVESDKAPTFTRNGRRFRGCWIGVWESAASSKANSPANSQANCQEADTEVSGGAA